MDQHGIFFLINTSVRAEISSGLTSVLQYTKYQYIQHHVVSSANLRHLPDPDCCLFHYIVDLPGMKHAIEVRQEKFQNVAIL